MTDLRTRNYAWFLAASFALAAGVFTLWPELDLWSSALFWTPDSGFWIAEIDWVRTLRKTLWRLMIIVFLGSAIAWPVAAIWKPLFGIGARAWAFSTLLFLVGPGLVVNAILKEYWGRARPAHVSEFGGDRLFTSALDITDQCARNCSFVSGEGAGAAALVLAVLVLTRAMHNRAIAATIMWIVTPLALVAMGLRVMMGRHFLSDTLFSVLIVAAIALILARLLKLGELKSGG